MMNLSPVAFDPGEILKRQDPCGKLPAYFEILKRENQKVNLVSRETLSEGLETLAAESLLPFDVINSAGFGSYLDIGTGGGMPAIPILLCREIGNATLLERNARKYLALRRILRGLNFDLERMTPAEGNFEEVDFESKFELITLRLVALTDKVSRKVSGLLTDKGHFVYYSQPAESFSTKALSGVTYRYQRDSGSPFKHFTVFQKTL